MEYISLNEYLKKEYNEKIYKVSIDAGFSCPNRDPKTNKGGCIFCSEGGSGDFASNRCLSITKQIDEGIKLIEGKLPKQGSWSVIAYFQAFTNTYAPVTELGRKYIEAVNHPSVKIISIATRPDCLPPEVIELIKEINEIKPVWVELGLQTINEETAKYIRRGYELSVYDEAVTRLKEAGIKVITHAILGLPGETKEDMLRTVSYIAKTDTFGIKLQLLHVLKNTDILKDYEAGKFETLSMEEYVDIVAEAVKIVGKRMVIHRLTGDGDRKILVSPLWSTDKKKVLNEINRRIASIQ